jgi:hypothetical protein
MNKLKGSAVYQLQLKDYQHFRFLCSLEVDKFMKIEYSKALAGLIQSDFVIRFVFQFELWIFSCH